MKILNLLSQIGLSGSAAKVYLYLIEAKKSTILEIARNTGIARSNVYTAIVTLKKTQLVSEAIEGKKKFFVPESPEHLELSARLKEVIARQAAQLLLPEFKKERYEAKIKYFEGEEGVKKTIYETLDSKERILRALGSLQTLYESFPPKERSRFIQARVKKRISLRMLDSFENKPFHEQDKDLSSISNIRQLREVRFLPLEVGFDFYIMTIDDKVLFFAPAKEGYSFSFKSPSFSKTMKIIFDFLWSISKP